jgi:Zn ribbon nucleic-acid-binding protein
MRAIQRCPHCHALGQLSRLDPAKDRNTPTEDRNTPIYTCRNCSRMWEHKVPQLKCQRCGFQQYAPYNTALVVARRMLRQILAPNEPMSNTLSNTDA